ncbi:hypothetical protein V5O48_006254 [Marasmius crinis-equi]|uniref:Fe2OG dioxygenase domain-containing protein n=1 Tax=Marasmius crinis-equi TaxID=585013 RepID=A0ABR3FK12_9AGAR
MTTLEEQIEIARAAVVKSDPWSSGTTQVPPENLQFFYRERQNPSLSRFLELNSHATANNLDALSASCEKATFGRALEDVFDESYRKAGKMDLEMFASKLDIHQTRILPTAIPRLLREASKRDVEAELYKLNVYDKGGFFRAHKDTPRNERMFGSLVVVFPTPHTGGDLVLRHDGKEFTFDSGKVLAGSVDTIAFVAFFSDVEHEVLPVTSGHRVTLTYNLYYTTPSTALSIPLSPNVGDVSQLKVALSALLDNPNFSPQGGLLGFGLTHSYPVIPGQTKLEDLLPVLKGSDQVISAACSELGLGVALKSVLEDPEITSRYYLMYLDKRPPESKYPRQTLLDKAIDPSEYGQIEQSWSSLFAREGTQVHPHDKIPLITNSTSMLWILPLSDQSGYEARYIAYGNQASLGLVYVKLSLVAAFGPSGDRMSWVADSGRENIQLSEHESSNDAI